MKPVNMTIIETKDDLYRILRESGLPLTVLSLLLGEIGNVLSTQINETLKQEYEQYAKELATKEEEEKDRLEAEKDIQPE